GGREPPGVPVEEMDQGASSPRSSGLYQRLVIKVLSWSPAVVPAYMIVAALIIVLLGSVLGMAVFPTVDAGQFQVRLRAPTGTRTERPEDLTVQTLDAIKELAEPAAVDLSIAYIGIVPPAYPINSVYLWTRGPEEAVLRVAMKPGSGLRVEEFKERLRAELPR